MRKAARRSALYGTTVPTELIRLTKRSERAAKARAEADDEDD